MRRRLLAGALVVASLLPVVPALPAAAAEGSATLIVAPRNGGLVGPGDVKVDVTVTNTGTTALRAGEVAISVDKVPVVGASTLLNAVARPSGVALGYAIPGGTARTPALAPGAVARVTATLPHRDVADLLTAQNGARLLWARYRDRDGSVQTVAESAITKMGRSSGRLGVGTVIPFVAPAGTAGVVDQEQQEVLASERGAWGTALAAAEAMPSATIALDPEVPASIRLAGDAAPESARDVLATLEALPNPVLLLPYGDQDVALARTSGAGSARTPSFDGVSTAPATAASTPAPTAGPTASPDGAQLTEWERASGSLVWPVAGTSSPTDLRTTGEGTRVVLGSGEVVDTAERAAAGPAARVGSAEVLLADSASSNLLRQAAAGGPAGAAAAAPLVGLLATDLVSGAAPSVLLTAGRGASIPELPAVLRTLESLPWVEGRSLDQLAAAKTTVTVSPRPTSVPAARIATARSVLTAERTVRSLGAAVTDAGVVTDPARLQLLAMLSAGWRGQDAAWSAAASGVEAGYRDLVGRVRIASGTSITAGGSDGTISVFVENRLPRAVTVEVSGSASNGRLRFSDDSPLKVTVPREAQKRVQVPYRSITNGSTTVSLQLQTPAGALLGPPSTRSVNVRAGFDTVVAVVLLLALAALLALGVYRNIRRRRRPREAAE